METGTSRSLLLLCVCLTTTVQYSNCRRSSGNQIIIIEYQRIKLRSRSIDDKSEVLSYYYEGNWLSEIVRKSVVRMVSYSLGRGREGAKLRKLSSSQGEYAVQKPSQVRLPGEKKLRLRSRVLPESGCWRQRLTPYSTPRQETSATPGSVGLSLPIMGECAATT